MRTEMRRQTKNLTLLICTPFIVFFFCEFIIYYLVQQKCQWPYDEYDDDGKNTVHLKALFIADTHLLGPYKGHWFDKLRREWQMHRAFMSATQLHKPDVTFFLGDIFDEGQWVDEAEFYGYVDRFHKLFPSENYRVLVGNHDIGFHYVMKSETVQRFYRAFNLSSADLIRVKGIPFVTVNSMTMENDGCSFCREAERRIESISKKLRPGEKPYLLQHFPLFRRSDESCLGEDAAPEEEKTSPFRPTWDCLSQSASTWLLKLLKPRAVFSGHTHHSCVYSHHGAIEYSVPSFSWRNRDNPSYLLVSFTPDNYFVEKCLTPRESTVIFIYSVSLALAVIGIVLILLWHQVGRNKFKIK